MSLATNIADLATRIATEFKAIRILVSGTGTGDVSGLDTTATNLVDAINEVLDAVGSGGASALDELSDVVITSAATGDILRFNGTDWVDVDGATIFQPLDSDLTSIAAVTTTSYGRAFLALANQAALMGLLSASSDTAQGIVELATNAEALTGTDNTRAVTPAALQAKIDALVASAPGLLDTLDELAAALGDDPNFAATIATSLAGKQSLDATLTALAGLATGANKLAYSTGTDTFSQTDFTAFARTILDDADAAAVRTTIDAQQADAELSAIAGLTSAADQAPYYTGSGTAALMTVTSAARTVLDDTSVANMCTTLGVGDTTTNFVTTFEAGLT